MSRSRGFGSLLTSARSPEERLKGGERFYFAQTSLNRGMSVSDPNQLLSESRRLISPDDMRATRRVASSVVVYIRSQRVKRSKQRSKAGFENIHKGTRSAETKTRGSKAGPRFLHELL